MFIRWPGNFEAGRVIEEPVMAMDVFPTFADLMGMQPDGPLDGLTLLPMLKGKSDSLSRDALYWHYPHYMYHSGGMVIRRDNYKLIEFFSDGRFELYDLEADPGEQVNLASAMPDLVQSMRAERQTWQESIDGAMPMRRVPVPEGN
jgi:arylsulfatase A-like enzyme